MIDDNMQYYVVAFGLFLLFILGYFAIQVNQSDDIAGCFEIIEDNCTPVEGGTMCMLTIKNICPQDLNVTMELV